ncbi:hypothetical protein M413DRAFT_265337 [Hebeloma cylindrosporum]|uniref:Uncharacterized protein n=1 Tax=Hebeloma cylindrosporum TaxID=76867 RepID=A0A0C3CDQ3_HEBCY|nr:hypothetical protein M413DRAFT_265337 [Hebeloma cylindrosporum h7]
MVHLNFDILSMIFIEALHTGSSSLLTLRLVNQAWYEITGRTPQLWTRLVLNRRSHFRNLKYAPVYFQKSGALPIDVHIALPNGVDSRGIEAVSNLLRGQTSKLRSFDLHVPTRDELEIFLRLIAKGRPAPLLEVLKLRVQISRPADSCLHFESFFICFTPAPRLTHLEIPTWPHAKPFPRPKLPNLTSITIDGMFADGVATHDLISFISCAPTLQNLVYKCRGTRGSFHIGEAREYVVHLPNLLTVDVTVPGAGGDLLCLINAPALTDARFNGFRDSTVELVWEGPPIESLAATVFLLSRRSRNLRRLTLEYTEFLDMPGDFDTIFDGISFPQLEEVLLIATDITDETLMNASRRSSSLKKLKLRDCDWVTGTGLLEFVRGRGSDFSLYLQDCRNLDLTQEDMDEISQMIKVEGLR